MQRFSPASRNARISRRAAPLCACALFLVTDTAWPRNWHVASTGDDAGPGDAAHPFRTISRAAIAVGPGDLCLVHAGVYRETVVVRRSGAADKPIRFEAAPGEIVEINGTERLRGGWTGSLQYASLLTAPFGKRKPQTAKSAGFAAIIRGNTIFNAGNAALCFRAQPTLIENNHVYEGGRLCKDVALIYTGGPTCAGSVVRYNWAHGCWTESGGGLGIRGDDQTRQLTVHHNVVWDCGAAGIIVKGDFNRVDNNTVLFIGSQSRPGAFLNMPTRPEPGKPWRKQFSLLKTQNAHSEIFNNIARTCFASRARRKSRPSGSMPASASMPPRTAHGSRGSGLVAPITGSTVAATLSGLRSAPSMQRISLPTAGSRNPASSPGTKRTTAVKTSTECMSTV